MTGATPVKQSRDDRDRDTGPLTESVKMAANEASVVSPAHEILAKLTLAFQGNHDADSSLAKALAGPAQRWSQRKSAALLVVGCALFWLLAYMAWAAVT